MKVENVVVIGGGLMGSSAAWQLASRGQNVILIEQQDSIYTFGSSFGEARISRAMGTEDDIFSFLQQTSVTETQKLISYLNANSSKGHSMDDIYNTSPVTYLFYDQSPSDTKALAEGQDIKVEHATGSAEVLEKFQMHVSDSTTVLREHQPYSGTMNPGILIQKLHQGIKLSGGTVRYNQRVTGLTRQGNHYRIQLLNTKTRETSSILCAKVVSAAGPYTGRLLNSISPKVDSLISIKRLFLAFFKPSKALTDTLSPNEQRMISNSYPVAEVTSELYYSMIETWDEEGIPIIKVGGHFLRTDIDDLDSVWTQGLSDDEIAWARNQTIRYFHTLGIECRPSEIEFEKGYSCVYSLTESEVPIVANIPYVHDEPDPNAVFMAGMSGVGAKGSLAYGLIAANLLLESHDSTAMYQRTLQALSLNKPNFSSDPIHK